MVKLNDIGRFLPFEISDRLIPRPAFFSRWGESQKASYNKALAVIPEHVILAIILTAGIWVICYAVHRKRDL
jgi:ABC-2 type transport system permease protein